MLQSWWKRLYGRKAEREMEVELPLPIIHKDFTFDTMAVNAHRREKLMGEILQIADELYQACRPRRRAIGFKRPPLFKAMVKDPFMIKVVREMPPGEARAIAKTLVAVLIAWERADIPFTRDTVGVALDGMIEASKGEGTKDTITH
jgi:hypothetical protein